MQRSPLVQSCTPLARGGLSEREALELEQVFKALADRHRVKILNALTSGPDETACVCDLSKMLGLAQPSVSYHLKQLLDAGLILREKRGTYSYYRLGPGALDAVGSLLAAPPVPARA